MRTSIASVLGIAAEDLDTKPPATTLDRVRTWLFSSEQPPAAPPDPELLFSAPGESLECVEIARRIRALAQQGTPFDRIAILLRNVEQYQPLVEEALRRAAIPGYFSRGASRPGSGRTRVSGAAGLCGRRLLGVALRRIFVARTIAAAWIEAAHPSNPRRSGCLPTTRSSPIFRVPPPSRMPQPRLMDGRNRTLAVPIGWEKLLVDASVIGGHDRWARRLRGLARRTAGPAPRSR